LAQAPSRPWQWATSCSCSWRREGPLHDGDQQPVELGALHVLAHAVVAVAQVPVAELGEALDAEPNARANWDGFPGSTKRAILEWIIAAKRPPTRASRVAETARLAAQGIRANQWRQPGRP
jgi:Bacteriocin-protection, YdeI or OmpD-Associated